MPRAEGLFGFWSTVAMFKRFPSLRAVCQTFEYPNTKTSTTCEQPTAPQSRNATRYFIVVPLTYDLSVESERIMSEKSSMHYLPVLRFENRMERIKFKQSHSKQQTATRYFPFNVFPGQSATLNEDGGNNDTE